MTNLTPALPAAAVGSSLLADWTRMLGTLCLLLATVSVDPLSLMGGNWFKSVIDRRIRLRVDESRGLGNRSFLHLVSCGSQQFLVSSSPAGVSMIAELMPEESQSAVTTPETSDFSKRLNEALPQVPTGRPGAP